VVQFHVLIPHTNTLSHTRTHTHTHKHARAHRYAERAQGTFNSEVRNDVYDNVKDLNYVLFTGTCGVAMCIV
jgi:hypothetical protein